MALAPQDLTDIRQVLNDAYAELFAPRFDGLSGRQDKLEANQRSLEAHQQQLEANQQQLEANQRELEANQRELEANQRETNRQLNDLIAAVRQLESKVKGLENDIKEIYGMLPGQYYSAMKNAAYRKLSTAQKVLALHAEITELAKSLHIKLPD